MAESFIETTTLHGLKDVFKSRSRLKRLVLGLVLVIFAGATVQGLVNICKQLHDDKRVTNVERMAPHEMPPVVLCPWHFENDSKVSALNITPAQLVYLKSYLQTAAPTTYFASRIRELMHPNETIPGLTEWRRDLLSKRTIGSIFDQIVSDDDLVLPDPYTYVQVEHEWYDTGRCSVLTRNATSKFFSEASLPYKVTIHDRTTDMDERVGSFAVGVRTGESVKTREIDLRWKRVNVLISRMTFKRIGCTENFDTDMKQACIYNCEVSRCAGSIFGQGRPQFKDRTFSQLMFNKADVYLGTFNSTAYHLAMLCYANEAKPCSAGCPIPCADHQYMTQITTSGKLRTQDDWALVTFELFDPDKWFLIREVRLYDFMTALSAIGGTTSLFFGASLWTLVHAVYWTVERVAKAVEKKRERQVAPLGDIVAKAGACFMKNFQG